MAIGFDTSLKSTSAGSVASHTFSYTNNGNILWLAIGHQQATLTSVAYNGVGMTNVGYKPGSGSINISLWRLAGPATGAHNVVITPPLNSNIVAIAASYTGAKQTGIPDASGTGGQTTTTHYTQSLTSIADNCWAVMAGCAENASALTPDGSAIVRQLDNALFGLFLLDSNSAKTPAGTDTLGVTSSSQTFESVMATFAPAPPTFVAAKPNTFLQAIKRASFF